MSRGRSGRSRGGAGRSRKSDTRIGLLSHSFFGDKPRSLTPRPDSGIIHNVTLQPLADLDLMIKNGWGDTPQTDIPSNWRTNKRAVKQKTGR